MLLQHVPWLFTCLGGTHGDGNLKAMWIDEVQGAQSWSLGYADSFMNDVREFLKHVRILTQDYYDAFSPQLHPLCAAMLEAFSQVVLIDIVSQERACHAARVVP